MKLAVKILAARIVVACLLFSFAHEARPQAASHPEALRDSADAGPVRRPAISRVDLENRGDDGVIIILSRPFGHAPFRHASRLRSGEKITVPVPNLPSLRASILRRDEVRRDARDGAGDDGRKRSGLQIGLAVGAGGRDGRRDKDNERNGGDHEGNQDNQYDNSHGNNQNSNQNSNQNNSQNSNQDNHGSNNNSSSQNLVGGLLLGTLLNAGNDHEPPIRNEGPPGEIVLIDAEQGSVELDVNGVAITVATGDAEGVEEDPGIVGAGTSIAISNDPAPVNAAAPPEQASTCYCGPDMTIAYVEALRRARDRIEALPDRDTGPWDAAWWLSNNGSSIDEIVRPARKPGQAGKVGAEMLCPSGPCADLPGAGDGTMRLFGVCLPKHVGNDIMYGLVTHLLGFRSVAQAWGGHWAQYNSTYSSWDPPQSRAAYAIGSAIAGLEGEDLTIDNAAERFRSAEMLLMGPGAFNPITAITTSSGSPVQYMKAVERIQLAYPALADCQRCPADATEPGTLLRDWSKSAWNSNDGSKTYPPGWKPEDDPPAGDEGE